MKEFIKYTCLLLTISLPTAASVISSCFDIVGIVLLRILFCTTGIMISCTIKLIRELFPRFLKTRKKISLRGLLVC
jgi:hypothetical protein